MLSTVLILFISLSSLMAQPTKQHPKKRGHQDMQAQRFAEMSQKLNLRDDQQQKMKAIMVQRKAEAKRIREEVADPKEKKEQMKALNRSIDEQVNAILDDAQKESYKKLKEEKRQAIAKKRGASSSIKPEADIIDIQEQIF